MNQSTSLDSSNLYVKYDIRYFVAVCSTIACLTSSGVWATYASVTPTASLYYQTSAFMINMMSLVFMIAFIPFGPMASYVLDVKGPKLSVSFI